MPFVFASSCNLPTKFGIFEMRVYKGGDGKDVVALVARLRHGRYKLSSASTMTVELPVGFSPSGPVVLRAHDQCHTSEIYSSVKCDCKEQLDYSLQYLHALVRCAWDRRSAALASPVTVSTPPAFPDFGASMTSPASTVTVDSDPDLRTSWSSADVDTVIGLVVYLPQEGRGIGLPAKVAAYALQEHSGGHFPGFVTLHEPESPAGCSCSECFREDESTGLDTVDANRALGLPDDSREYGGVIDVLSDLALLGATRRPIVLMTNNPRKVSALAELGVSVVGSMPCIVSMGSPMAAAYVRVKAARMGHAIPAEPHDPLPPLST